MTDNWEEADGVEHVVAQQYLDSPYLINNLKFDLRIYVLLYGMNPLKIYLYEDGIARFATKEYKKPKRSNMKNMFMHLTNYSINKTSADFVQNENEDGSGEGHKKSLA